MGLLARLRRRSAHEVAALDPADPSLEVVVEAFEAARADSAVLAEAADRGVDLDRALLVRHHLVGLAGEARATAARLLAQDGYVLVAGPPVDGSQRALACRTQVLTALSVSQERSRMAGLAQRLGGDVAGWDALAPTGQG